MAASRHRICLLARLVFFEDSAPRQNVVVTLESGRIAACEPYLGQSVDVDLGNAAIIAPLVNAHTHLEFSNLAQPLRGNDDTFASWIEAVIDYRKNVAAVSRIEPDPVQHGLRCSQAHGCLLLGEIATHDTSTGSMPQSAVGGIRFLELIGVSEERAVGQIERAGAYVNSFAKQGNFLPGLSPHAPYSVSMNLLEHVVQLSNSTNVPLAMHLAETEEELRLLDGQDGPLAELLQQLEIWPPPHIVRHTRPLDYLRSLARASRALVIHGNFLADDELAFLAKHRERMTLVFCPRTHAYFAHRQCPLLRANELGVRIALGTDSCASNPDLSVWREAIYVAEHYPEFPKSVLLQSFTQFGREAFYGPQQGFSIGSAASFCVIRLDENTNGLPSAETDDPWHALFTAGSRPQDAWWHGERITLESRM